VLTISAQIGVAKMNAAQPTGPMSSTIPIRAPSRPSHLGTAEEAQFRHEGVTHA
jgi:hypothetical protein